MSNSKNIIDQFEFKTMIMLSLLEWNEISDVHKKKLGLIIYSIILLCLLNIINC